MKSAGQYNVEDVLADIKASGCLGKSKRQASLLEYLLQKSASNLHMDVNQYALAVDVLGRPESFDANIDSIVRVEMHRLRANLKSYNSELRAFEVMIPAASYQVTVKSLASKGGGAYRLTPMRLLAGGLAACLVFTSGFVANAFLMDPMVSRSDSVCSETVPNVAVVNSGQVSDVQAYTDRLLSAAISQHTNLNLIDGVSACSKGAAPQFTMDYLVVEQGDDFDLSITVFAESPSKIVSSDHVIGSITDRNQDGTLYFEVLKSINELAKPYGVISRTALSREWKTNTQRSNYRCLVVVYDSFAVEDEAEYQNAHQCLERAADTGLATADTYGALAASYIEQARNYRQTTVDGPFKEAENILAKFDDNWLDSAELVMAKMAFEVRRTDYNPERLRIILSTAESKYDTNPHVLLSVSLYAGYYLGEWERAKRLSDRVKLIHSERDQSVFVVDAAYSFLHSDSESVLSECEPFYSPNSINANLLLNACAIKADNKEWIDKTQENLARLAIDTQEKKIAFIDPLKFESVLTKELIRVLSE